MARPFGAGEVSAGEVGAAEVGAGEVGAVRFAPQGRAWRGSHR